MDSTQKQDYVKTMKIHQWYITKFNNKKYIIDYINKQMNEWLKIKI